MSLLNHNINNLSGGVSQQPVANRFDNQVESMNNCLITVAQGLRKRNPLKEVNDLNPKMDSNVVIHSYDRGDGLNKYGMTIDNNGLRIFDETGDEKTVNIVGGIDPITQWVNTKWDKEIKFLTVGDTTWVLNKSSVVTNTVQVDIVNENKAFYWVKKSYDNGAGVGYTYQIVLNGQIFEDSSINTITSALALETAIDGQVVNGVTFAAKADGSIVYITGDGVFTFESGDSWGNQASKGWRDNVSKIADLPASMASFTTAEIGTIAITGTDRDNYVSYYLYWDKDHWTETYRPNTKILIDSETLPARITQIDADTFEFGFNNEWEDRLKGDEDSSPTPSFIGYTISNMFFFKNRLGFTSEENVLLSETAAYYNFFATTAMEVLDSDPIDAAVDSNTVSIIRNVNTTAGALTLWADNAQFMLGGGDILSPATTRISQTSSYDCDNSLAPIVVDNEIIFFNKSQNYTEALIYTPASIQSDKSSAESVSAHIPEYLPNTINLVVYSSAHNMVFLKDSLDNQSIYVYKYYVTGGKKVISAWHKWTFDIDIKAMDVLGGSLFIIADGMMNDNLLRIDLEPQAIDSIFLDKGINTYTSIVVMSSFNVQTSQGTQFIREPFYIKNMKVNTKGSVDLDIINSERQSTITVNKKHLDRKLFIGGHSEKINVGFSSSYDDGFEIDTLSIEGRLQSKSKNV